jgi:FkbM family methyltransferase
MRPGLRRELLTTDFVLPVLHRYSRSDTLSLHTRSPSARGDLYFGRESFPVDRVAYFGIFLEGWYRADFREAVVVDVGAHKGYFGGFALLEGAREVHSFEPEATNFAALERAAATFGARWVVRRAAVAAAQGTVTLNVSAESAGHSIVHAVDGGPRRTLRTEQVEAVAMREVLSRLSGRGRPLIVKIDAEGAEGEIVLGTPSDAWRGVDVAFLEVHRFAATSTAEIVDHLLAAGLEVALHEVDDEADLVVLRRPT